MDAIAPAEQPAETWWSVSPGEWELVERYDLVRRFCDRPNAAEEFFEFLNRIASECGSARGTPEHLEAADRAMQRLRSQWDAGNGAAPSAVVAPGPAEANAPPLEQAEPEVDEQTALIAAGWYTRPHGYWPLTPGELKLALRWRLPQRPWPRDPHKDSGNQFRAICWKIAEELRIEDRYTEKHLRGVEAWLRERFGDPGS
jgi:hypothetical protein